MGDGDWGFLPTLMGMVLVFMIAVAGALLSQGWLVGHEIGLFLPMIIFLGSSCGAPILFYIVYARRNYHKSEPAPTPDGINECRVTDEQRREELIASLEKKPMRRLA
jgi:hypothetical protein